MTTHVTTTLGDDIKTRMQIWQEYYYDYFHYSRHQVVVGGELPDGTDIRIDWMPLVHAALVEGRGEPVPAA